MNKQEKKNTKPVVVGVVLALLLVVVLCAALLLGPVTGSLFHHGAPTTESDATDATDATGGPAEPQQFALYYNLDRQLYAGGSEAGLSTREPESDGYYHIRLAGANGEETLLCDTKKTVNKADSLEVMGLTLDEQGHILSVLTLNEMGLSLVGNRFYVDSVQNPTAVAINSSKQYDGITETLNLSDSTVVCDVTGASGPVGSRTQLMQYDRILGVQNDRGEVLYVFVIQREIGVLHYCRHCDQEVIWREWTYTETLPNTSGHYYLASDVSVSSQTNIQENASIILSLNGKTVSASSNRVYALFNPGTYLAIDDWSEGTPGKIVSQGELDDQGGIIWVRYGQFDFYKGTVDGSRFTDTMNGAAVHVDNGAGFNMYEEATLIGGTARAKSDPAGTGPACGYGGSVYVAGIFNMYGGTITGGKTYAWHNPRTGAPGNGMGGNITVAPTGTANLMGGVVENGVAENGGGNLFVSAGAHANISGSVRITGGQSTDDAANGGNVRVSAKGVINMEGGTIEKGVSHNRGGNIALYGDLNMSGGMITGGVNLDKNGKPNTDEAFVRDYNIFANTGNIDMSGGTIRGYVLSGATGGVKLSGTARITGAASGQPNLYFPVGKTITVGTLRSGASIGISSGGFFTEETSRNNMQYFFLDYPGVKIEYQRNRLFAGEMHCLCGTENGVHTGACNGETLVWSPWIGQTSMPNQDGNWLLVRDLTVSKQTNISKTDDKPSHVAVCLNGKTVRCEPDIEHIYLVAADATLTIMDHNREKTGSLVGTAQKGQGMVLVASGTVNLYNGVLDGTAAKATGSGGTVRMTDSGAFHMYGGTVLGASASYGGAIYLAGDAQKGQGAVMTMTDGTISGGSSVNAGGNIFAGPCATVTISGGTVTGGASPRGGNIAVSSSQLTVTGGVIADGKTDSIGGNLYVTGDNAKVTLSGEGRIVGGKATTGGNVYMKDAASMTVTGGAVTGGAAQNGGNFILYSGSALTLSGGEISNGTATTDTSGGGSDNSRGGNVFLTGSGTTLNMTGGTISNGKATSTTNGGGNVYMNVSASALLSGGTVSGGSAVGKGGNIHVSGANLTLSGEAKITGGTANNGGSIYLENAGTADAPILLTGGSVSGGKATSTSDMGGGGNLYVSGGFLTLSGCTVTGGKASSRGGNLFVSAGGSITVSGEAKITGGEATTGGNVCMNGASPSMTITGGTISGGKAENGGNIIAYAGSILTVSDGEISEGKATDRGGNVFLTGSGTVLNMTGGAISNGKVTSGANGGGNVYLNVNASVLLSGGTVSGGTAVEKGGNIFVSGASLTLSNKASVTGGNANNGGSIYLENAGSKNAPILLSGGTVTGGAASSGGNLYVSGGALSLSGCTVENGKALISECVGGNLFITAGGSVTVSGETKITGGQAAKGGGNVYMNGASSSMTVTGGTISGGTAQNGGNIIAYSGSLTVSGGEISNGTATIDTSGGGSDNSRGGNIFLTGSGTVLNMTGGTISNGKATSTANGGGNVYLNVSASALLSGGTVSGGKAVNGGNIYVTGATVTIEKDASVQDGAFLENTSGKGQNIYCGGSYTFTCSGAVGFTSQEKGIGNGIYPYYSCDCGATDGKHLEGCSGQMQAYTEWSSESELPNTAGRYRLTKDVTVTDTKKISGEVFLDLCGHTVTCSSRVYALTASDGKASLTILDSGSGGEMVFDQGEYTDGAVLAVLSNGNKLTIYGGTFDASKVSAQKEGALVRSTSSSVTIRGGTLIGGKNKGSSGNGGVLSASGGTVTMSGGTISGKYDGIENDEGANGGGAIHLASSAAMTMTGGTISGGKAKNGGNIIMYSSSTFTMSGGEIFGGEATASNGRGGNIFLTGTGTTATIYGDAKVYNGTAKGTAASGNVYVASGCKLYGGEGYDPAATPAKDYGEKDTTNIYVLDADGEKQGGVTLIHRVP